MSGRADRWWRPPTTRRPAQRARARQMHTDKELDTTFDTGYAAGYADGLERLRQRDEQIRRLAEAAEAAQSGDSADLMALAESAGVTPLGDVDGGDLVDELEAWLRDREGDG